MLAIIASKDHKPVEVCAEAFYVDDLLQVKDRISVTSASFKPTENEKKYFVSCMGLRFHEEVIVHFHCRNFVCAIWDKHWPYDFQR